MPILAFSYTCSLGKTRGVGLLLVNANVTSEQMAGFIKTQVIDDMML